MKLSRLSIVAAGWWLLMAPVAAAGDKTTVTAKPDTKPSGPAAKTETATFASGCFWCTESDFQDIPGVIDAVSGYIGGKTENPTYSQVSSGVTGHAEAVQITFDPAKITYKELLKLYWEGSDPTVADQQFCDHGSQYRPAIFFHNEAQEKLARSSRDAVAKFLNVKIYTGIEQATRFWPAEDYHQDYYQKNPVRYKYYRFNCGRDRRLEKIWKKPPSGETGETLKF